MKNLTKKQYDNLEEALNHLYVVDGNLMQLLDDLKYYCDDENNRLVEVSLDKLQTAMSLIFNVVDSLR